MKLSTRTRYGTRALLDIALYGREGPVLLRDIAQRQQISLLYLEHLITPLVAAGILRTTRGARGGVWLAKSPQDIKLSNVIGLLEGSIAPVECITDPKCCTRSNICAMRDIWGGLGRAMNGILEAISLQDLVEQQERKQQPVGAMYYI